MVQIKPCLKFTLGVFTLISMLCGIAVLTVGIWFGASATWNFLSLALLAWGCAIFILSILGLLSSCGVDCCRCLLALYLFPMLLVTLGNLVFVILAAVQQDDWIQRMADAVRSGKDDNQEEVDMIIKFYDSHWTLFLGFFGTTAGSGLCGVVTGFIVMCSKKRNKRDNQDLPTSSKTDPNFELQYGKKRGIMGRMFGKKGEKVTEGGHKMKMMPKGAVNSSDPESGMGPKFGEVGHVGPKGVVLGSSNLQKAIANAKSLQVEMSDHKPEKVDTSKASKYYKDKSDAGHKKESKLMSSVKRTMNYKK